MKIKKTVPYFCTVKPLARFVDFLLKTSLFTACCATALCMATGCLINGSRTSIFNQLHVLVFGSTLLVYNAPRLIPRPYGRQRPPQKLKPWYRFFFFAGMAMTVYGLWGLSLQMLLTSGALGLLAFAYYLPLLPFKNKKRIRDIGWLKISVLAVVWTTATAVLPIIYWDKLLVNYPVEILIRFVFIFMLCVLFEIRDVRDDIRNNIHTLPHKVGVGNSYRLINTGLVVFCLLSILQYTRFPIPQRLVGALLTAVVTWGVVQYIRRYPSERAYLVLADGVMLVYALLVILI